MWNHKNHQSWRWFQTIVVTATSYTQQRKCSIETSILQELWTTSNSTNDLYHMLQDDAIHLQCTLITSHGQIEEMIINKMWLIQHILRVADISEISSCIVCFRMVSVVTLVTQWATNKLNWWQPQLAGRLLVSSSRPLSPCLTPVFTLETQWRRQQQPLPVRKHFNS